MTEEAPVGGGRTVDLYAKRSEEEAWVEVETGRSDIPANIKKLSGLVGRKVMIFTTRPLLAAHEESARSVLGPDALLLTTPELESLG